MCISNADLIPSDSILKNEKTSAVSCGFLRLANSSSDQLEPWAEKEGPLPSPWICNAILSLSKRAIKFSNLETSSVKSPSPIAESTLGPVSAPTIAIAGNETDCSLQLDSQPFGTEEHSNMIRVSVLGANGRASRTRVRVGSVDTAASGTTPSVFNNSNGRDGPSPSFAVSSLHPLGSNTSKSAMLSLPDSNSIKALA